MDLPLDVLLLIAKVDLASYRSMLAVPRFARYSLLRNVEFRRHFTVKEVDHYGTIKFTLNGKRHSDNDQPALTDVDGIQEWYRNGLLHRDNDQPAVMYPDGTRYWYRDGILYAPK